MSASDQVACQNRKCDKIQLNRGMETSVDQQADQDSNTCRCWIGTIQYDVPANPPSAASTIMEKNFA